MTKDELDAYDYASMRKQDERGKTTVAVRKAAQKAYEQGVEEERVKQLQKEAETVKELYRNGISIEIISISTRLSMEKVKQILEMPK